MEVEDVALEGKAPVGEGSTDDTTVVEVEKSSPALSKVLLGVTSLIKNGVVVEEAGVEIVDEVKVVVVGVLI